MVKKKKLSDDIVRTKIMNMVNNNFSFTEKSKKGIEETRRKTNKIEKQILENHRKIGLLL